MESSAAAEASESTVEMVMLRQALERLVARNDRIIATTALSEESVGEREKGMVAFRGERVPRMGVGEYVERIGRYAGGAMSPSCFVVVFALLDRAAHRRPANPVGSRTVHRLLLASLLLATKLLDDAHHDNAFFARVGGVSNAELNRLELELLFLLDFKLTVPPHIYESYYFHLQKEMLASGTNKEKIARSSPMMNGATIDKVGDFETNKQRITQSQMMNGTSIDDEDGNDEKPRRWSLSPPRRSSVDCC